MSDAHRTDLSPTLPGTATATHRLELVRRAVHEVLGPAQARAQQPHIRDAPAHARDGLVERSLAVLCVGQVRRDRDDLLTGLREGLERCFSLGDALGVARDNTDVAAVRDEVFGDGVTETGRAARDVAVLRLVVGLG